jgi:hypothetical protein
MSRQRTETLDSFVEMPKVEVIPLNQAELLAFLSPIEVQVFELINAIRKDPRPFITRIEEGKHNLIPPSNRLDSEINSQKLDYNLIIILISSRLQSSLG